MKKILLILVLSLFIVSCSDSDDEQTFLEKHEGTVWELVNPEIVEYLRINNNESTPFGFWVRNLDEEDCYYYDNDVLNDAIIKENSNNTFEFELSEIYEEIQYLSRIKITINGDIMIVIIEEYSNGELYETDTENFERSSADVDSFILCAD
ncbi:MAG: hypothetical protein HKO92_11680 [Flavobacteriaceae bacterium]|nr:hypothetical protein [Flavobacteriaceae bacterium]